MLPAILIAGALLSGACPAELTPTHMPPARVDRLPLPDGLRIVYAPRAHIARRARELGVGADDTLALWVGPLVTVLLPNDVPEPCDEPVRRHELGHARGWRHG